MARDIDRELSCLSLQPHVGLGAFLFRASPTSELGRLVLSALELPQLQRWSAAGGAIHHPVPSGDATTITIIPPSPHYHLHHHHTITIPQSSHYHTPEAPGAASSRKCQAGGHSPRRLGHTLALITFGTCIPDTESFPGTLRPGAVLRGCSSTSPPTCTYQLLQFDPRCFSVVRAGSSRPG